MNHEALARPAWAGEGAMSQEEEGLDDSSQVHPCLITLVCLGSISFLPLYLRASVSKAWLPACLGKYNAMGTQTHCSVYISVRLL